MHFRLTVNFWFHDWGTQQISTSISLSLVRTGTSTNGVNKGRMPNPVTVANFITRYLQENNIPPDGMGADLLKLTEHALPVFREQGVVAERQEALYTTIQSRRSILSNTMKADRVLTGRKGLTCEGCRTIEESPETTFKHCSGVRMLRQFSRKLLLVHRLVFSAATFVIAVLK